MILKVKIFRFEGGWEETETPVVHESSLTIFLNGERIVTLACSDNAREFLAVGFLVGERFIDREKAGLIKIQGIIKDDKIMIEAPRSDKAPCGEYRKVTLGLGKGVTFFSCEDRLHSLKISSSLKVSPSQVFQLRKELSERSTLYRLTHGVHNAALCTADTLELFHYDLGRHNAIDKLYGQCLIEDIPIDEKILITSGRVSSEILTKAGAMGVPILISLSAPTDKAISLADKIGLTLIARVRENEFSVYTHPEGVVGE